MGIKGENLLWIPRLTICPHTSNYWVGQLLDMNASTVIIGTGHPAMSFHSLTLRGSRHTILDTACSIEKKYVTSNINYNITMLPRWFIQSHVKRLILYWAPCDQCSTPRSPSCKYALWRGGHFIWSQTPWMARGIISYIHNEGVLMRLQS